MPPEATVLFVALQSVSGDAKHGLIRRTAQARAVSLGQHFKMSLRTSERAQAMKLEFAIHLHEGPRCGSCPVPRRMRPAGPSSRPTTAPLQLSQISLAAWTHGQSPSAVTGIQLFQASVNIIPAGAQNIVCSSIKQSQDFVFVSGLGTGMRKVQRTNVSQLPNTTVGFSATPSIFGRILTANMTGSTTAGSPVNGNISNSSAGGATPRSPHFQKSAT